MYFFFLRRKILRCDEKKLIIKLLLPDIKNILSKINRGRIVLALGFYFIKIEQKLEEEKEFI